MIYRVMARLARHSRQQEARSTARCDSIQQDSLWYSELSRQMEKRLRNPLAWCLSLASLVGCHRQASGRATAEAGIMKIQRTFCAPDTGLARRGLGRLDVAVRRAEQPTMNLRQVGVPIRRDSAPTVLRFSDSTGVAHFDSLPVGRYRISMVGAPIQLYVPILAGSRTEVEIWTGTLFLGMAPPPNMAGRAAVTTCPVPDVNRRRP